MNYSGLIYNDTANAKGISTTLFVSGCEHNCPECHNPESHNPLNGEPFTIKVVNEIIESLKKFYVKNFVLSGGDPFYRTNVQSCLLLIKKIRQVMSEIDKKINIIVYTGYQVPQLINSDDESVRGLLYWADYIIDGRFRKDLKPKYLDLRGSINQQAWEVDREKNLVKNVSSAYFRHPTGYDGHNIDYCYFKNKE